MKNILVLGGRGFIGFNALRLWKRCRPQYNYVEVDGYTYADQYLDKSKNIWLDTHDIPRFELRLEKHDAVESLNSIIETFNIDTIVNFSAESHVDNSIENPNLFYESNVVGHANVLLAVKKYNLRLHYVSTDEVLGVTYPNSKDVNIYSPLSPSSAYSASKASAELITMGYIRTYGINATISRCCNNFGPWQHPEKFIPTIITHLENRTKIPVYGNGEQYRQWIHVDDHNMAIMDILENKSDYPIYHISSNQFGYMQNIELVKLFVEMSGRSFEDSIEFVNDRPGHDVSYYLTNYRDLEYGSNHITEKLVELYNWYRGTV